MQIFLTKWFARWAAKEGLQAHALRCAIDEIEEGLFEAYLGNQLIKKRISINGRGKSSGLRTLVAFKIEDKAFFLYGFAKNQRDNIDEKELQTLKRLASHLLSYDHAMLQRAINAKELIEVCNE
jgi:hypothetical protein